MTRCPVHRLALAFAWALALACVAAGAGSPAFAQDGPGGAQAPGGGGAFIPSVLIGGNSRIGDDEPSALPLADEQKIERAKNLVRLGYADQAVHLLDEVAARYPDDLDVLLARAEILQRTSDAEAEARFLEQAGKRPVVAKALASHPRRAGFWYRYAAEATAESGRRPDAIRLALLAWETSPEQAAWTRVRLEAWSDGRIDLIAKDVTKLADRHPERADLALEAARLEALSGRVQPGIQRLARFEARQAKAPETTTRPGAAPDESGALDSPPPKGQTLWQLSLALAARGDQGVMAADSALVALALGDYDPALREQAVRRLFDERVAAGSDDANGGWIETAPGVAILLPPGGTRGHATLRPPPAPTPTPTAADETKALMGRLAALERVWRRLPPSPEMIRLGLELSERMKEAGDASAARRVADLAAELAQAAPGAAEDPELSGRLAVRRGESALAAGDLEGAARAFQQASTSGASDPVREEATFLGAETVFFEGRFDSASAEYDRFTRAFPTSRYTNDALDRIYLMEGDDKGAAKGLGEFAKALRLSRGGKTDDALAAAQEAESAAGDGPVWTHAGLLIATLLEARGRHADAVAKAVAVAETRPDDRLAPVARRTAGDLYLAQGQDALALAQYEELLARYPRSWLAPETRRVVGSLRAKAGGTP